MNANATPQQKIDASADPTADPTGQFAFNKSDVNRDGRIDRADFGIVEAFNGKDYRTLADQLSAVIATNGTALDGKDRSGNAIAETPRPINLVDVELNDTGDVRHAIAGTGSDAKVVHDVAVARGTLLDGDNNLNGTVNLDDFTLLAAHFNQPTGATWVD